jgi:hypothetical protein
VTVYSTHASVAFVTLIPVSRSPLLSRDTLSYAELLIGRIGAVA